MRRDPRKNWQLAGTGLSGPHFLPFQPNPPPAFDQVTNSFALNIRPLQFSHHPTDFPSVKHNFRCFPLRPPLPAFLLPLFSLDALPPSITLVLTPSGAVLHHLLLNPSQSATVPPLVQMARHVRFQPQQQGGLCAGFKRVLTEWNDNGRSVKERICRF